MFGEHIRQTNSQVFDEEKGMLQNRKNSAMRSHFIGLKRDLKKQNLAMPKQLIGADQDRFVRKRVVDDTATAAEDFMAANQSRLSSSPHEKSLVRASLTN